MTIYALDASGSMWDSTEEVFADMRRRVAQDDTIIVFSSQMDIHRDPGAFLKDPQMPQMNWAEMRDLYDWVADNAPGETLIVYTDGGMAERHTRRDAGRTVVLVTSTPVSDRLDETFPGARIVPRTDW